MNKLKVKKAKIKYSADKLVVVGGTAGVFTVISAAKTILIENDANLDELSWKLHLIYTN